MILTADLTKVSGVVRDRKTQPAFELLSRRATVVVLADADKKTVDLRVGG